MSALTVMMAISALATLAMQVGIVVVVAVVVRRHRPDAYRPLLLWSASALASHVMGALLTPLLLFLGGREGVDSMLRVQAVTTGIGLVMQILLMALLARGLVRLAEPPKVLAPGGSPPYR